MGVSRFAVWPVRPALRGESIRTARPRRALTALLCVALLAHVGDRPGRAEEAVALDGTKQPGELSLERDGRLMFTVAGKEPRPASTLDQVRFASGPPGTFRATAVHWAHLRGGERLSGELLDLDGKRLRLRTPWAASIHIPRPALAALGKGIVTDADIDPRDRLLPDVPAPLVDPGQDELRLHPGDQLFGPLLRATARTLVTQAASGERTFTWDSVHWVRFRQETAAYQATEGEHVRLWLHGAPGLGLDELEGAVRSLDDDRLVLRHASLGDLPLRRSSLARLRWLFSGRRIELDRTLHHLGRKVVPGFSVPRPEGLSLLRTFQLDLIPEQARLHVDVIELKGPDDGSARALGKGGPRTDVFVNTRKVGSLNELVRRSARIPRRLTLPLPPEVLRVGNNMIELRQTADVDTGRYADCVICGLRVELPRAGSPGP